MKKLSGSNERSADLFPNLTNFLTQPNQTPTKFSFQNSKRRIHMTYEEAIKIIISEFKLTCQICMHPQEVGYCDTCNYKIAIDTITPKGESNEKNLF